MSSKGGVGYLHAQVGLEICVCMKGSGSLFSSKTNSLPPLALNGSSLTYAK